MRNWMDSDFGRPIVEEVNGWYYKCDVGFYYETSLFQLVVAIFRHRLHHFLKGQGFND